MKPPRTPLNTTNKFGMPAYVQHHPNFCHCGPCAMKRAHNRKPPKMSQSDTPNIEHKASCICATCEDKRKRTHKVPLEPIARTAYPIPHDPLVNHPSHYNTHPSGVECADIAEHHNFNLGNVIKYVWRTDNKDGLRDLRKAQWYLNREIARLESQARLRSKY